MTEKVTPLIENFLRGNRLLTILTGAGVSAESGIPTYRGMEGYWTQGSQNYQPEEIGTFKMFKKHPYEVWKFALYRRSVCLAAQPNPAHWAIVQLEQLLGDRFQLITQNVDRLHLRAGNSPARMFEIHGHIDFMRCSKECRRVLLPIPEAIAPKQRGEDITEQEWSLLKCPQCRNLTRPHVLWFDESYNEHYYRHESSLKAAAHTGLLLIAGTSGATNLPRHIVKEVLARQGAVIDINTDPDFFAKQVQKQQAGGVIAGKCGEVLPQLLEIFTTKHH